MLYQRTIQSETAATGVGLHRGERVCLVLHPAPVDYGVVFCRVDLPGKPKLSVSVELVRDTRMSTTLISDEGVRVGTIEHLLSALSGLGIDNVLIELDAAEVPIMDGSASPFIYLIEGAGVVQQHQPKKYVEILEILRVEEEGRWVSLAPHEGFSVDLSIDFNHAVLGQQQFSVDFSQVSYLDAVSRARTFGFMQEVELMRKNQLGLGGSLDNAIVIDDEDILNVDGLRFHDEFVRHKVLDAVGDLYVLGHPIIGAFSGFRSGHALNNRLLRLLLSKPQTWRWRTFDQTSDIPPAFSRFHSVP